ncbi:MAG TPA: rod shape-determining protein [Patescibacteria group bacterium]|nr:rod shape-determining protein [Patescibacteria group bacterium]
MIFKRLYQKFTKDLSIDLGTSNTLVYTKDKGIILNEPSVVAVNTRNDQIVSIGKNAKNMIGKTPPHIEVIKPLVKGIISDFEVAEKMLKYFMDLAFKQDFSMLPRPRVVISVPLDITEVERKAVEDAALSAGAREIYLIEESMAAAIGARMNISDSIGNMVVNLGGGLTEISVISLNGIVTWKSIPTAGDELNRNIIQYAREQFNLILGEKNAEDIKIKIGSAHNLAEPLEMEMRGRDILSGLPKEIVVNDSQIRDSLARSIKIIIENVKATLEITPPDLIADIYERGMVLTGGGAALKGLDVAISEATQIPVRVADDPSTCVVRGTGFVMENLENYQDILIPSTSLATSI